jgi:hypothetical protein
MTVPHFIKCQTTIGIQNLRGYFHPIIGYWTDDMVVMNTERRPGLDEALFI